MDKKERFGRYWLVFYLYMLCIFVLSSIPGRALPMFARGDIASTLAHFAEYLIFGILCIRAARASYARFDFKYLFIAAAAFSFAFALSDEVHQHFVPGRFGEAWDLVTDGLGSLAGILFYRNKKVFSWLK